VITRTRDRAQGLGDARCPVAIAAARGGPAGPRRGDGGATC